VLNHDQVRLELACLGLGQNQRPKRFGGDYHTGQTTLPQFNAVVETPR
jgi:hypothetical protein